MRLTWIGCGDWLSAYCCGEASRDDLGRSLALCAIYFIPDRAESAGLCCRRRVRAGRWTGIAYLYPRRTFGVCFRGGLGRSGRPWGVGWGGVGVPAGPSRVVVGLPNAASPPL